MLKDEILSKYTILFKLPHSIAPTNGHIQTYPHTPSIHHSKYIVAECKARVNIKSQHHVISVEIMGYTLAQTDRTVQLKHRGIRKHDIPVHTWQMLHIVLHTFCITNDYHPSSYHITSAYICLFSQGLPKHKSPPKQTDLERYRKVQVFCLLQAQRNERDYGWTSVKRKRSRIWEQQNGKLQVLKISHNYVNHLLAW